MSAELIIQNGSKLISPPVLEDISWSTSRAGEPGKLTFSTVYDSKNKFEEGNAVMFKWNKAKIFYGFIFSKKSDKSNIINVTCYDQLRYFKNKDTYVYENKTAGDVVKMICSDFNIKAGKMEKTGYKIASRVEDSKTLFDIVQNAIDETMLNTGKLFVLYDDFGALSLKSLDNMKTNILIDAASGENYDYSSSIDENTYNKIKLIYDNDSTKKRDVYIAQSSKSMNKWGVLQYYDTIQKGEDGKSKADALLKMYNTKTRQLNMNNIIGNVKVRAGSLVVVSLNLYDVKLSNYMLVESCEHKFKLDEHTMTLKLRGGEFTGE